MSVPESLAFDMYGTLVDPIRIWKQLELFLPRDAQRVADLWRQKQLEYTFRLTAMERYEDFEDLGLSMIRLLFSLCVPASRRCAARS